MRTGHREKKKSVTQSKHKKKKEREFWSCEEGKKRETVVERKKTGQEMHGTLHGR